MGETFFFNVDAVVCQNNGQFQVWELNIWQFIVIVEIEYFLNLNEYYGAETWLNSNMGRSPNYGRNSILPLLRCFNPAEPVVEKSVIL